MPHNKRRHAVVAKLNADHSQGFRAAFLDLFETGNGAKRSVCCGDVPAWKHWLLYESFRILIKATWRMTSFVKSVVLIKCRFSVKVLGNFAVSRSIAIATMQCVVDLQVIPKRNRSTNFRQYVA